MSKRTPGPEPYFTVSTKPMLAWGALLITSQLTVAAPFSNAPNADIEPDTVHHGVIARPDGRHGAVLTIARQHLDRQTRPAATKVVVDAEHHGRVGLAVVAASARIETVSSFCMSFISGSVLGKAAQDAHPLE